MSAIDSKNRSRSISSTMLAGLKLGQPEAWERLVEVWTPVIYGWCRRRGVEAHSAADIVQEVLSQVFLKVPQFERKSFTGWVSTITKHKIADHFRASNRQPKAIGGSGGIEIIADQPAAGGNGSGDDSGQSLADDPDSLSLIVRQVLNVIRGDFDEHTFQAFWRTTIDGLSAAEVADELGMTVPAVRQAKCRILKRLREELDAMGIRVTPPRCT